VTDCPAPWRPAIHDVVVAPLAETESEGRVASVILAYDDHLLRRFGAAEIHRLAQGAALDIVRAQADEVWALLDGQAECHLEDARQDSPTRGARLVLHLDRPQRFLLPFGVRLHLRGSPAARLLRLMTHSEAEDPPPTEGA